MANNCLVAHHGPISTVGPVGDGTLPLTRGLPPARAVLERQTLHVADLQTETTEYPEGSDFARRLGFRATLVVPLMRAEEAIGVITIRRTDARPFTDQQVDLLKTFADQAVIARCGSRAANCYQRAAQTDWALHVRPPTGLRNSR